MNQEVLKNLDQDKPESESRMGLLERNTVQIIIMQKMIEENAVKTEREWVRRYGKTVSKIIDDPQNIEIRELIKKGVEDDKQYTEAAELIISLLQRSLLGKAA